MFHVILQFHSFLYIKMLSISRTWRRISSQIINKKSKKRGGEKVVNKSVRFYAIDTVYYTHSSAEYDRTPSEEDLSCGEYFDEEDINRFYCT